MYILYSIQEFNRKIIGIYRFSNSSSRNIRRGEKEILKKGIPEYAIFILSNKITKGEYDLHKNFDSFVIKTDKNDGVNFIEKIQI